MNQWRWTFSVVFVSTLTASVALSNEHALPRTDLYCGLIRFNDDGAWCWFQDERALVCRGSLIVGSVACGTHDPARKGNVELVTYDLASRQLQRWTLHESLEADDHNAPALWQRNDGKLVVVWSKHGSENKFYHHIISPEQAHDGEPAAAFCPSETSRITYSNLLFLEIENDGHGRLYNFFRGLDASFKPSFAFSDDGGQTWSPGNVVIDVPLEFRHRPYVKYAGNGRDTVHFLYTDGHPRDFENSVYHLFCRGGMLHRSDGTPIRPLAEGLRSPDEGTRVFRGSSHGVAWVGDLHLSADGYPCAVFSVQKDSAGLAPGHPQAGQDHRYHYARWNGMTWQTHEIAYAGTRLYPGEDDYTGNICLDPNHLDTVYISTDADPVSGRPLISTADRQRHYEIYRGVTADRGTTWKWQPVTGNSTVDNLRPLVPKWKGPHTAVLWFRGRYHSYRHYQTEVVGLVFRRKPW